MSLLKQLSAQTLIGSERRSVELPTTSGELENVFAQINAADETANETRVLRAAGVLSIYERAGYQPPTGSTAIPNCAIEPGRPITAPHIIDCLHELLRTGPRLLIRQTLRSLAQTTYVLPPKLLPGFLTLGKDYPTIQPLLSDVIGERGRWLAQFNPEWNYSTHYHPADNAQILDVRLWERGAFSERLIFIAQLREQQPDQARDLIANTLSELDARERVSLLEKLRPQLTASDTELLTLQLKDRSKEVRKLAVDLLGELPACDFVLRAQTRLATLLVLERKLIRKHWQLEAPQQFDPVWVSDTIEEKRPQTEKLGERGWWLYQLASLVPLHWWQEITGMDPFELLQWATGTDWQLALWRAWHQRIVKEKNRAWAAALLAAKPMDTFQFDALELLAYLPPEHSEPYWIDLLNSDSAVHRRGEFIGRILAQSDNAISAKFARAIFNNVKQHITDDASKWDYPLRQSMVDLAAIVPAECFAEIQQGWPLDNPKIQFFSDTVAQIIRVIQLRNTLNQFFSE